MSDKGRSDKGRSDKGRSDKGRSDKGSAARGSFRPPTVAAALALVLAIAAALVASPAGALQTQAAPPPVDCSGPPHAVVSDIDETLTASDGEFYNQLLDPSYDPVERPAASDMMRAYADKGYWVVYITARPDGIVVNGRTIRGLTSSWLTGHDFTVQPENSYLYLAPDILSAIFPRYYKAAVVKGLQEQGFVVDYAYGNAQTDFQAFADAGIPLDQTFSIGELAGYGGTVPITEEGYETHLATHMPAVHPLCAGELICHVIPYSGLIQALLEDLLEIRQYGRRLSCGF